MIFSSVHSLIPGQSTPALLPGKFHGQRSLIGFSPWGHKESDMTERLSLSLSSEASWFPAVHSELLGSTLSAALL